MPEDSFTYTSYDISDDSRTVNFRYRLARGGATRDLCETITFPMEVRGAGTTNALRALHIALGVSYYKTFLPGVINHPYAMDAAEADFWNTVWENGLGEFLYVNKLSRGALARFNAQDGIPLEPAADNTSAGEGAVLGIGGGKDSAIAGELLKELDVPVKGFVMATGEQLGQAKAVADAMEIELLVVQRQLDRQLIELQKQPGAYSGHVPISLIFGLVGCVLALSSGSPYVVVANESSASTPRIEYEGSSVNHQWSKSFTFEKMLQQYTRGYISDSTAYFSAIRQLTSVAVAKIFATYPQFFEVFTSDNYVFRIDPANRPNGRWSLESPKSLSSFILLSPWLDEAEMLRIFGINFLDEASLEPLFLALAGLQGEPPLDCVGTVEELALSLRIAVSQGKFAGSALVKIGEQKGLFDTPFSEDELQQMLALQPDASLPPELAERVTTVLGRKVSA